MKKRIITGIALLAVLNLWGQAPEMFRYQGRLVEGTSLVNAVLPMSFKLYDAAAGGTLLYEDTASVPVVDGLYAVNIGENTVYGSLAGALNRPAVYLELTVDGETFSPRERLLSVPYVLGAAPVAGDPSAVEREIINPRWTRNTYADGDITMSDSQNGLMWLYDAGFSGDPKTWSNTVAYCEGLTYAGYSDWRLPSRTELASQFYEQEHFLNVKMLYPDTEIIAYYWSGTIYSINTNFTWSVEFLTGASSTGNRINHTGYVWPVRDIE